MDIRIKFDEKWCGWHNNRNRNVDIIQSGMDLVLKEIGWLNMPVTVKDIKNWLMVPSASITLSDYIYWIKPENLVNGKIDYEILPSEGPDVEVIIHGFETIDISSILKEEGESE